MRKTIYLISFMLFATYLFAQQSDNNYQIEVTLKPLKNQWIYLTNYFANTTKYLIDSAFLDNHSKAMFKGNNSAMDGGVYALVFPEKKSYIDFIVDRNKDFSIYIDTSNLQRVEFKNSPENNDFYAYQKFASEAKKKYSKMPVEQFNIMKKYKTDYITKNPKSFLSTLFLLMDGPSIPSLKNGMDSIEYFSSHYWDNIPLDEQRILRTPLLEEKLLNYIKNLIPNNTDSMKNAAYRLIDASHKDTACYRYFLSTLAIQYGNSEIPTQGDAFFYIFNKYIENQKITWIPENLYHQMERRSNFIAGNIIGNKAFDITLLDTSEKPFNLYNINSKYIVLCFWDPTCSHCLKIVPKVDSFYHAKWEKEGVTLVGIYVDGGEKNWRAYLANNLKGWTHGYETDSMRTLLYSKQIPNFRQLYDIQETPVLYLLDKDKKIVIKKITPEFLNAYISYLEEQDKDKKQ